MQDMNDDYANGAYIPGAADYPLVWSKAAAAFRERLGPRAQLAISYGPSNRMAYDHFLPDGPVKGIMIFVHGGFWLKFDKSYWSHLAEGALANGWSVVMPSYDLCPDVRIAGITQQISQAIMKIAKGNTDPISLVWHSAGGHLVARMLAPGMLPSCIQARFTHVLPISPVANLEPLLKTSMNNEFGMDNMMAQAESPLHQPASRVPTTVWVGANERPAFLDQASWLVKAWSCNHVISKNAHHFNVIEALSDPGSKMIECLTTVS
jgi:arylformamidase